VSGRSLLAAIVLALLVAGCMPTVAPAGPPTAPEPALTDRTLVAADGSELPLRLWLPDDGRVRAAIIALHGFNDYSNFFDETGRWLVAEGVAGYAYDQRGFGAAPNRGLWPGEATLVADLKTAVAAVRARHPGVPVVVFGESMGAAVAMLAVTDSEPAAVDGVILSAPAVWGRSSMPWYQTTALWIAAYTFPWGTLTGRGLGIQASDNLDGLRALGRDPMVIKETRVDAIYGLVNLMDRAMAAAPRLESRILLLYGAQDQLIPPGAIRELVDRLPAEARPRQRLALYANGYHLLLMDTQRETVWRDLLAWLNNPAAPLPSAADQRALARLAALPDARPPLAPPPPGSARAAERERP
jgi:alpha-beta hydrolase superfamily lysophospholipase